jgi:hypothetical protein
MQPRSRLARASWKAGGRATLTFWFELLGVYNPGPPNQPDEEGLHRDAGN